MDASFWHQRWESNQTAFHLREANPLLVKYFKELSLVEGGRVFLPMCGKTLDIPWLLSNGYRVAGAELSKIAIGQLFVELGVEPKVERAGKLVHYSANDIDIFCGDIFDLSSRVLGPIDATYDRAALVALPEEMRGRYAAHVTAITEKSPQLLVCYEYDQRLMEGPPFSVGDEEVRQRYGDCFDLTLMEREQVVGGLKGACPARENVWLLTPK